MRRSVHQCLRVTRLTGVSDGYSCFLTNAYASVGGIIVPVLLLLLMAGIVFIKAFQLTPQWQAYDDVYRGRYNITGTPACAGHCLG